MQHSNFNETFFFFSKGKKCFRENISTSPSRYPVKVSPINDVEAGISHAGTVILDELFFQVILCSILAQLCVQMQNETNRGMQINGSSSAQPTSSSAQLAPKRHSFRKGRDD